MRFPILISLVGVLVVGLPIYPTSSTTSPGTVPIAVHPQPVIAPPPVPGLAPATVPTPFTINVNSPSPLLPITAPASIPTAPQPVPVDTGIPLVPVPFTAAVPSTSSASSQVYSKLAFVFVQTYGNSDTLAIGEIKFFDKLGAEVHPTSAVLRSTGGGVADPNTLIDKSTQSAFVLDRWKPQAEVEFNFAPPQVIEYYEVISPASAAIMFDTYPSAWNVFRYDGPNAIPLSPAIGVTNSLAPNTKLNGPSGRFYLVMSPPPSYFPQLPSAASPGGAKGFDSEMMAVVLVVIAIVLLVAILFAVFVRLRSEYTVPVIARGGGYPPAPAMAQYVLPGSPAPIAPPPPPLMTTTTAAKALPSFSPMRGGAPPPAPLEMMMVQPTFTTPARYF